MTTMSGGCLCGAVRFTAAGVETNHSACHCGMCRRWSGGAPLFSAEVERVMFEGEEHLGRYDSSEWAQRGFCKTCGANLFYLFKPKEAYFMGVGGFDDASLFHLVEEIFIDRKPEGYALAGEHPRMTEAEMFAKLAKVAK